MTPDLLKILHAPGHAPDFTDAIVAEAESTDADSLGYSEAYRLADDLMNRPHYVGVCGHSSTDTRAVRSPRGDAGDNPVCVNKRHPLIGSRCWKVDSPGTPRKFAPERWVVKAVYRWAGHRVAHISVHPSPVFVGALKWRRVMREALREARACLALGYLVILSGDLQTRFCSKLLRDSGLEVGRSGVDYIAHSPELVRVRLKTWRPKGMDHDWMLCTYALRTGA